MQPLIPPSLEPVPFAEVAAVLTEAARRSSGGAVRLIPVHGDVLVTALQQAGFMIMRAPAASPQGCL